MQLKLPASIIEDKFIVADIHNECILGLHLMRKYGQIMDLKRGLLKVPHGDTPLLAMETTTIKHRKRTSHWNVDWLSQRPCDLECKQCGCRVNAGAANRMETRTTEWCGNLSYSMKKGAGCPTWMGRYFGPVKKTEDLVGPMGFPAHRLRNRLSCMEIWEWSKPIYTSCGAKI